MDKKLKVQLEEFEHDVKLSHELQVMHQNRKKKDPEFYEYNKILREHGFNRTKENKANGGMPPLDVVGNDLEEYFNLCDEYDQIPSLKAMCLYIGMSTPMYTTLANNPNSEYSNLFRGALDYVHSVLENRALNNKVNSAVYMFTAQNFYGMDNVKKVDIHTNVTAEINTANAQETLNALRQELIKERAKRDNKVAFVRPNKVIVVGDKDE